MRKIFATQEELVKYRDMYSVFSHFLCGFNFNEMSEYFHGQRSLWIANGERSKMKKKHTQKEYN